ncbi:putative cytochrome P450 9h1, partial [Pseudolycoriella hygida]
ILSDNHDTFFRNVIHGSIEEREKKKIVRNDMLNLLLLAKEGKLNDEKDKESDQDTGFATVSEFMTAKTTEKLKNWTDEDLVAQCIIFFLAGFTGLSITFCFLCYELSLKPEMQERLFDEITETKKRLNGKQLTFEVLQKMKYMDMLVSEALRKWPIASAMDRAVGK